MSEDVSSVRIDHNSSTTFARTPSVSRSHGSMLEEMGEYGVTRHEGSWTEDDFLLFLLRLLESVKDELGIGKSKSSRQLCGKGREGK